MRKYYVMCTRELRYAGIAEERAFRNIDGKTYFTSLKEAKKVAEYIAGIHFYDGIRITGVRFKTLKGTPVYGKPLFA